MATDDTQGQPQQRVRPGRVTKSHAKWKQSIGKDGTDHRSHGYKAKGGPITRSNINDRSP